MRLIYHPLFLISLYLFLHAFIRLYFGNSIQVDDREQILLAQEFNLGYGIPQPPLYSWLSFIFFKFLGANLFALTTLKYSLIFATFYYIHKISRYLFQLDSFSKLTTFSFLFLPSLGWHMHQGFTHTIILGLGIIMTTYYTLRISESQSPRLFLLLGVSIAIGLLGKYSFLFFLILIMLTILTIDKFRTPFLSWKSLLALAIFLIITGPHLLWLQDNWQWVFKMASERLNIDSHNLSTFDVLGKLSTSYLGFIGPLIIMIFISNLDKFGKAISQREKSSNELFFRNFFLILFVLTILFSLSFEIKHIKVRWLHPLLMIIPFWFFEIINRYKGFNDRGEKFFNLGLVFLFLFIILFRLVQNTVAPQFGYSGRLNVPIIETLQELKESQKVNVSFLRTPDFNLGAHLFSVFDTSTIVINGKKFNTNRQTNNDRCLIIFDNDGSSDVSLKKMEGKYGEFEKFKSKNSYLNYSIFYKYINIKSCI